MTNWQFITIIGTFVLTVFGFIVSLFVAVRSLQTSISSLRQTSLNEQFAAFRNEIKAELEVLRGEIRQNDKRYEERFKQLDLEIREVNKMCGKYFARFYLALIRSRTFVGLPA